MQEKIDDDERNMFIDNVRRWSVDEKNSRGGVDFLHRSDRCLYSVHMVPRDRFPEAVPGDFTIKTVSVKSSMTYVIPIGNTHNVFPVKYHDRASMVDRAGRTNSKLVGLTVCHLLPKIKRSIGT